METGTLVAVFAVALALPLIVIVWGVYNHLVRLRLATKNSWADVDVELKRRHDLLPPLIETVRGYMSHEHELLTTVTRAHAAAEAAGGNVDVRTAAELQLSGAVQQLLVSVQRYPQLQAVENFRLLHEQLVSTENRVAFARQHYNEAVRQYNTALSSFPGNTFGRGLGFKPAALFAGAAEDRAVPAIAAPPPAARA